MPLRLGIGGDDHHEATVRQARCSRRSSPGCPIGDIIAVPALVFGVALLAWAIMAVGRIRPAWARDDVRGCLDPAGRPFCLWTRTR